MADRRGARALSIDPFARLDAASQQNAKAGLLFLVLAVVFFANALTHKIGTPLRMGAGFFPMVTSVVMGALGAALVVHAFLSGTARTERPSAQPNALPWRAIICITAAPLIFAMTIKGLGLIPATFLAVLTGALANREMRWRGAALAASLVTLGCWMIFRVALGLPLQTWGAWLF